MCPAIVSRLCCSAQRARVFPFAASLKSACESRHQQAIFGIKTCERVGISSSRSLRGFLFERGFLNRRESVTPLHSGFNREGEVGDEATVVSFG